MADSTCNFFINSAFNANFDITWSFQYSMYGPNSATGGFSTFLIGNSGIENGGTLSGLGFAPYDTHSGVTSAVVGVMIDSNNVIQIKTGSNFHTITSFPLFDELSPLVKSSENFNIIRFNLTNVCQTLKIAVKNPETNRYKTLASVDLNLSAKDTDFYKIGFGYSSPLKSGDNKATFKIKDIHVQGNTSVPTTTYRPRIPIIPAIETFYILQSPLSGEIYIGNPDPITVGSLMHRDSR